jgi:hypothetical protein
VKFPTVFGASSGKSSISIVPSLVVSVACVIGGDATRTEHSCRSP